MANSSPQFKQEIQQMMYIAGETQDTSDETTTLIESIIHGQVVHMLTTANDLALRRGARLFTVADLIFQFRHNTPRVDRLRTFLTWKAIRKTVKDADDKDALAAADDEPDVDDGAGAGAIKAIPAVHLPWDLASFFAEQPPDSDDAATATAADALTSGASLEKLRRDDERTRTMTVDEYATWSEYRHASFTWRKVKRFRAWAGLGVIADHRAGDDVLDVLGFVTSEMVKRLTAEAMAVQAREGLGVHVVAVAAATATATAAREKTTAGGLFGGARGEREAVAARHVRVAFQRLQCVPKKRRALLVGTRLPRREELQLI
ncbi:hypothetical protein ACHAP6_002980 [Verticillium nonalfalfae]